MIKPFDPHQRKKVEAKAINICQSGPSLEHVEDSEEDKIPLWICKVEYEPEDRLFMTRILSEPAVENLCATFTISQKRGKNFSPYPTVQKDSN